MAYLIVFLGGGLGSAGRHGLNVLALRLLGGGYPLGTVLINTLGSLLMGMVAMLFLMRTGLSPTLRLFLATGVLGGWTTFSTFSLETVALYQRGQAGFAALYALGSVVLGVGALLLGMALARHWLSP